MVRVPEAMIQEGQSLVKAGVCGRIDELNEWRFD
jgi:hypothetical protein